MLAPERDVRQRRSIRLYQSTVDVRALMRGGGVSWYGFYLGYEFKRESAASGLTRLARMVAEGRLKAPIDLEAPCEQIAQVAQKLYRDRAIAGKAGADALR